MSIEEVKAGINMLLAKYPEDFRFIGSREDIDTNRIDISNSEIHGPFNNGDLAIIEVLNTYLSIGKQAFVLPVGRDKVLVQTSKGGKLFDVIRSPRDESVRYIRKTLEEIHERYVSPDGNPYLCGGLESYIYPDQYVSLANKFSYSKVASYDIADRAVLDVIKGCVENRTIVIVAVWTQENRIDVYTNPGHRLNNQPYISAKDQVVPMISLGSAILGFVLICCYGGIPFGVLAIILGFLGFTNSNNDPERYGGRGLAIAGMAIGSIELFLTVVWVIIAIFRSI